VVSQRIGRIRGGQPKKLCRDSQQTREKDQPIGDEKGGESDIYVIDEHNIQLSLAMTEGGDGLPQVAGGLHCNKMLAAGRGQPPT
jgi:hypothetical protein